MKKLILLFLLFPCIISGANEITEDYFDIASNYCTYGKYEDALIYVNKIIQIEPSNTSAQDLKETLLRLTNINSTSYLNAVNPELKKAYLYKKQGNSKNEISELLSMKDNFWANYFLAEHYRNENDFQKAVTYYDKAIILKPNYSQAYLGLAKSCIDLGEYQLAKDKLDKYISYNSNSDIAYALRAKCYMNMNYLSEAENDIKTALDIEENISYLLIEAQILYYKGKFEEAKENLNLLSRNIQTAEVYKFLGLCDYALNDYPSALLNLNKAIILSDEDKTLNSTYNNIKSILEKQ